MASTMLAEQTSRGDCVGRIVLVMFSRRVVERDKQRMDIEAEIRDLKRRVGDLEGAVSVLTGQFSKVHPDLLSLTTTTAARFDRVDDQVGRLVERLDLVNTQVWSLRDDLPELIAQAMRVGRSGG